MTCLQQYWFFQNPPVDPYWQSVILLMHFDGGYTDSTALNQAFNTSGVSLSSVGAKFGESVTVAGTNPGGGGGAGIISAAKRSEYDLVGVDFTIEAFVKLGSNVTVGGGYRPIAGFVTSSGSGSSNGGSMLGVVNNGAGNFLSYAFDGSVILATDAAGVFLSLGTWYHVAVTGVWSTSTYRLFVDGALVRTAVNSGVGSAAANRYACIGNFIGNSNALHGALDEVRITRGVARYLTSFTAPTSPFVLG